MTLFDFVVVFIIGLSILLSIIRGLVREVLALTAWVAAFVSANVMASEVAPWMPDALAQEDLRFVAGFLTVFVAVLIVMSVLAMVASRLVKSAGLAVEDRVLGAFFGVARGLLVVLIIVLAAGFTALPRQAVWRDAMLSDPLEGLAERVKGWLPPDLARRISFE